MNEFEKEMLSFMKKLENDIHEMKQDISELKQDVSVLKQDVSVLKQDVSELKETSEITRVATNYNGEKLECLISELKHSNIIAWFIQNAQKKLKK